MFLSISKGFSFKNRIKKRENENLLENALVEIWGWKLDVGRNEQVMQQEVWKYISL